VLKIYNSLTRKKEKFVPHQKNTVFMYVCGITVYDDCHIGHARTAVAFDVLYRYLQFSGFNVKYVRNITDIDDKIIKRAAEKKMSTTELTAEYTKKMHEDYKALGLMDPSIEPKATESIESMLKMIATLMENNYAYLTESGDVLFNTRQYKSYGELGHQNLNALHSGARVAIDKAKKNITDSVKYA